jgi:hypothetical protein
MAGSSSRRRRSRARAEGPRRRSSRAASSVEVIDLDDEQDTQTAAAASTSAEHTDSPTAASVQVAETVHGGSLSPAPVSRSTVGYCKRCEAAVGEWYNEWHKITGTYYLPTLLGSYSSRLRARSGHKPASVGTVLDGW